MFSVASRSTSSSIPVSPSSASPCCVRKVLAGSVGARRDNAGKGDQPCRSETKTIHFDCCRSRTSEASPASVFVRHDMRHGNHSDSLCFEPLFSGNGRATSQESVFEHVGGSPPRTLRFPSGIYSDFGHSRALEALAWWFEPWSSRRVEAGRARLGHRKRCDEAHDAVLVHGLVTVLSAAVLSAPVAATPWPEMLVFSSCSRWQAGRAGSSSRARVYTCALLLPTLQPTPAKSQSHDYKHTSFYT